MNILIFLAGVFVANMYNKKKARELQSEIQVLEDKIKKKDLQNYKKATESLDKMMDENLN